MSPYTAESFLAPDVFATQNALAPRFQARAQWVAALPTINTMAQFLTADTAYVFPNLSSSVDKLLRRPLNELSNMRSADDIDAAETADNHILVYGDFSNFVIVDRVGARIEAIPQLFGTNQRPTGQRAAPSLVPGR